MQKYYLEELDYLISKAKKCGADEADAIIIEGESTSVTCKKGDVEKIENSTASDVGLRVIIDKRQALVSSSMIDKKSLDEIAQKACDMAKYVPKDEFCGLADKELLAKEIKEIDSFDENLPSVEKMIDDAKQLEQSALDVELVSYSDGAEIGFSKTKIGAIGSNGFSRFYKRTGAFSQIVAMAGNQKTGNMQRDYDFSGAVFYDDLKDVKILGKKAGQRAVKKLNPKKISTKKMPVIFEPRVAKTLLNHFASAINGRAVARKTSFLKDSLNEQVFSKNITITQDPFIKRGLRSRPVDAEGLAPKKSNIIENGVLNSFILDLSASRKLGLNPTGNAVRGTGSPPSPSVSNLYINPSEKSFLDMIKNIKEGFLITELIGQGVRINTGDYSRGASGFLIENGQISYPVSEVTIAGNLKEMFLKMTPSKELEFLYGIDSPYLMIDEMTVAGE